MALTKSLSHVRVIPAIVHLEKEIMMLEEENNASALTQSSTNAMEEAQALTEMSMKLEALRRENEQLAQAKKKYYDTILNGTTPSENVPTYRSAKEVREDIKKTSDTNTNLANAKLYVELNDAVIREGGESIFLPRGKGVTPTVDERELAERFPKVLSECIETAQDNPAIFNNEFNRHIRH